MAINYSILCHGHSFGAVLLHQGGTHRQRRELELFAEQPSTVVLLEGGYEKIAYQKGLCIHYLSVFDYIRRTSSLRSD